MGVYLQRSRFEDRRGPFANIERLRGAYGHGGVVMININGIVGGWWGC